MGRYFYRDSNYRSHIWLYGYCSRCCFYSKNIILYFPCIVPVNHHIWSKGFGKISAEYDAVMQQDAGI